MSDQDGAADYLQENRRYWASQAPMYAEWAPRNWEKRPTWGIWNVPEAELHLLPDDLAGKDAVELGCGTAYISAWLARRGAKPVGIDYSPEQLATARRMQEQFGIAFPLHLGNAEATPFPDESFDFAVSEYGAAIWCDPYKWIPEAARILRPGGRLMFLGNSTILMLTAQDDETIPASDRLLRPQRGIRRFEWPDTEGIEFHISPGEMIRLLRSSGFDVEDLVEIYPPDGATTRFPYVTADWARQWPSEEVWKARKRA
jgi:SAM-dependent methyltransferase